MMKEYVNYAYKGFAQVYDSFMWDIDYNAWLKYLYSIWNSYNFKPRLIADIACGTGSLTSLLAKDGFDLIGIDNSEEMLAVAKEKALSLALDILYLKQDMSNLNLFGTVDCFLCLCDGINYLLDDKSLLKTFKLVNNYLNPNGLFIFDINTRFKYEALLSNNTFAESIIDAAYIWENSFVNNINEYLLELFIKEQNSNKYLRLQEVHYQRAYSIEEVTSLLSLSGLDLLDVFDAFTFTGPKNDSERLYFITREKGK